MPKISQIDQVTCQAEVRILQKTTLLDCPRVTLIIHIVRHIDQRVQVKGDLFAPKGSYANTPYVQCSETLIIYGSCVKKPELLQGLHSAYSCVIFHVKHKKSPFLAVLT